MLTVYKATPSPRSWSFGLGVRCENWRQANVVRARIYADAQKDKDNALPLTYDAGGNLVAEGWQKGFQ